MARRGILNAVFHESLATGKGICAARHANTHPSEFIRQAQTLAYPLVSILMAMAQLPSELLWRGIEGRMCHTRNWKLQMQSLPFYEKLLTGPAFKSSFDRSCVKIRPCVIQSIFLKKIPV